MESSFTVPEASSPPWDPRGKTIGLMLFYRTKSDKYISYYYVTYPTELALAV